jgi:hypothetical protein
MTAALLLWMLVSSAVLPHRTGQVPQLALEIRLEHDSQRAGDEIRITFLVTNVGASAYRYTDRNYDRSGRMGEYQLRAYDERGAPVPDPRTLSGHIGGGLGSFAALQPGQRFSKVIALNSWALVTQAGVYTVRGAYVVENGPTLESPPLTVRVLPRSDTEMGRYIDELAVQLRHATDAGRQSDLIRRLMYTADRRAARPLLELGPYDGNSAHWIEEAFSYYLPRGPTALAEALAIIRRKGLSQSSVYVLEQLEAPPDTIRELLGEALTKPNDDGRAEAALAAQRYPDDRFMEPLIELATIGPAETRARAIYALAYNRTDAGVEALRRLRRDADPEIRMTTEQAIEIAYRMSRTGRGRPLRTDDFPDVGKR